MPVPFPRGTLPSAYRDISTLCQPRRCKAWKIDQRLLAQYGSEQWLVRRDIISILKNFATIPEPSGESGCESWAGRLVRKKMVSSTREGVGSDGTRQRESETARARDSGTGLVKAGHVHCDQARGALINAKARILAECRGGGGRTNLVLPFHPGTARRGKVCSCPCLSRLGIAPDRT